MARYRPMVESSSHLPVETILFDLNKALANTGTVVLQAPPGSGKTTRVPLALLEATWLAGKRILMLEPRRLAATNAARHMASLRNEPVGGTIGYAIRYERKSGPSTRLEIMTEGLLIRRLQNDPELADVGLVIFDEFHERSMQADLALAQMRDRLPSLVRLHPFPDHARLDSRTVAELIREAGSGGIVGTLKDIARLEEALGETTPLWYMSDRLEWDTDPASLRERVCAVAEATTGEQAAPSTEPDAATTGEL